VDLCSQEELHSPNHPPPPAGMLELTRFLQSSLYFTGSLYKTPKSAMVFEPRSSKKRPLFPKTPLIWTPDEIKGSSWVGIANRRMVSLELCCYIPGVMKIHM
jgi:hypothetical protein